MCHNLDGAPSRLIRDFWDVLFELSPEMQKRFLRFVTGTDRVPVGGMAEMVPAYLFAIIILIRLSAEILFRYFSFNNKLINCSIIFLICRVSRSLDFGTDQFFYPKRTHVLINLFYLITRTGRRSNRNCLSRYPMLKDLDWNDIITKNI